MNSKTALPAIMSNLRKKKKSKDDPRPRLIFEDAATEIAQALRIEYEAAAMTLYGLCATGRVSWLNDQGEVIEEDDCTISKFEGKPKWVIAGDVRSRLTDWSSDPLPDQRRDVIQAMLAEGLIPPRTISWKKFYDQVRDKCNGWIKTGGERKPASSFSDKQIQRIVKYLRAK